MIKKIAISLAVLIIVLVTSAMSYVQLNKSPQIFEPSVAGLYHQGERLVDDTSIRSVETGKVVGFADSYNTHAWLGIPYASPPVGKLRWRAPQPAANWSDTLNAANYGAPCVQYWGVMAGQDGERGDLLGDEDCLYLNLWAPKLSSAEVDSSRKPVMVWIHGGGNDSGSGMTYQGHHLAGTKDVIVVTINYRLGLMGWFSHDAIRATSTNLEDASGNYGTLDIIAGLKWVQNNIAQFGGDPDNVTIFGESAGGRNVYSMLASPLATGLFQKAIVQSGTVDTTLLSLAEDFPDDRESKAVFGLENSSNSLISLVLKKEHASEPDADIRRRISETPADELMTMLRSVDAKEMMTMATDNVGSVGYIKVARVLRDGYVLPKESLLEIFRDPSRYNNVPLIVGSNRDEQKVFMARNPEYVDNLFGVIPRIKDKARYNRISKFVSDNWKASAVDEPAKIISSTTATPVYAYRFDWDEEPNSWIVNLAELVGASHGMEINFVFGDFRGGVPMGPLLDKANSLGRKQLSLTMMDYWAEFAHAGSPGTGVTGEQVAWKPWKDNGNNIMLLDTLSDVGPRMAEVRDNVADIKAKLANDDVLTEQKDRCRAYAALFLHGYQTSDFWNASEYQQLGCADYPVGNFREG